MQPLVLILVELATHPLPAEGKVPHNQVEDEEQLALQHRCCGLQSDWKSSTSA